MKTFTEKEILDAVKNSNGFINEIARALKCNWHTAKKQIEKYPSALDLLETKNNEVLDQAEKNIINAVNDGDLNISKWLLSTPRAKNRGYYEPPENDQAKTNRLELLDLIKAELDKRADPGKLFDFDGLSDNQISLALRLAELYTK